MSSEEDFCNKYNFVGCIKCVENFIFYFSDIDDLQLCQKNCKKAIMMFLKTDFITYLSLTYKYGQIFESILKF